MCMQMGKYDIEMENRNLINEHLYIYVHILLNKYTTCTCIMIYNGNLHVYPMAYEYVVKVVRKLHYGIKRGNSLSTCNYMFNHVRVLSLVEF